MYTLSDQVQREMPCTQMGLWIDRCGLDGREIAWVLKGQTPVLKAIYHGASLQLLMADVSVQDKLVRCVGLQVHDQIGQPLTTLSAYRTRTEQRLLLRALRSDSLPLHIFDEMERNVGSGTLRLDPASQERALAYLETASAPYAGRYGPLARTADDKFQEMVDQVTVHGKHPDVLVIGCSTADWSLMKLFGIGSGYFQLDHDEGSGFEQAAHQLVESVFGDKAFRSPNVQEGSVYRELSDSLLIGDEMLCLMEAKALGVLGDQVPVDGKRRARRVAKDVEKGLRQLKGAIRSLRVGAQVQETHQEIPALAREPRRPIQLPPRDCVMLGMVVVSDFGCDIDWKQVTQEYVHASDGRTLYQVIDLTELRTLVGTAKSPIQFINNVILRWGKVHEFGLTNIRVRIRRK